MRRTILDLARRETPDHFGLAYDVWAPAASFVGAEELRDQWLTRLEQVHVSSDYATSFARWKASFSARDTAFWTATLTSRLLLGHGNVSPTDVGLTVHRTWGVPIIPGSALKGMLSNYVQATYGPETLSGLAPRDPNHPEPERARYQGVVWSKTRPQHGPGEVFLNLFGAPSADSDDRFGSRERQGGIVFHDAVLVPPGAQAKMFVRDILTPHQSSYYRDRSVWPNDYDDPIPVSFMSVRPGAQFLIAVSGLDGWVDLAASLLRDALSEWGIGGKTAANYGRFTADLASLNEWQDQRKKLTAATRSAAVAASTPAERWTLLVAERRDLELLEWARRVFEAHEDPLSVIPVDKRPSAADPAVERLAFRDALENAGYLKEWFAKTTLKESVRIGDKKLRLRAKAVREAR